MDKYLIVLEKCETGFSAYSPDVWGCVVTGESLEQTLENMRSVTNAPTADGFSATAPIALAPPKETPKTPI